MSADTSKATGFFRERRGWLIAGVVVIAVIVLVVIHLLNAEKVKPGTHRGKPAKKMTHLDLLSKLTNKERGPLSSTRTLLARVPRIARADRQAQAIRRKRQRSDGCVVFGVLTKSLFNLVVPD